MQALDTLVFLCGFLVSLAGSPLENEYLFEGDLKINEYPSVLAARKTNKWPKGVMPYVISFTNPTALEVIDSAMEEWQEMTCVRFVRRTTQKNYVEFITGDGGCWSNGIGVNGNGRQRINLDSGCWSHGIVIHEIGHALGFWHEQSRPDRDDYVTIMWDNIRKGLWSQFKKYSRSTIDSLGIPYDYNSIMHYGAKAFTKNGRDTIVPKKSGVKIGQRSGLSGLDILQANLLYKCFSTTPPPTQNPSKQASGYIAHYQSKTCLSPLGGRVSGENHPVVASPKCSERANLFTMLGNGMIQHIKSSMCLHPTGGCLLPENNTELVLSKTCTNARQRFEITEDGLFMHLSSETCVRPAAGITDVRNGTRFVTHSGCNVDKYAFIFSASPPPNAKNLAFRKKTTQSSTFYGASSSRAVDGNRNGDYHKGSCTHTWPSRSPWWRVDLGKQVTVASVLVANRADCCWERISNFAVSVGNNLSNGGKNNPRCGGKHSLKRGETKIIVCNPPRNGRYVTISITNNMYIPLTLCEVEVYAAAPVSPFPPTSQRKPDIQGVIQHSTSELCISPKYKKVVNNTVVVLTASCSVSSARFRSLSDGSLQHVATSMCLSPKDGCERLTEDTVLVLIDRCQTRQTAFKFTEEGALMHVTSETCARPSSSPVSSKETTMVILTSVCDATNHEFELITAPQPTATSLPIEGDCGHVTAASTMVIGGINAKPGAWPWQVAIKRKGRFICGGSLVKANWVVTAAHCISTSLSPGDYSVVLGDHDRKKHENREVIVKVKKYFKHPSYNKPYPINNDIALLQLVRSVKFTPYINTVCLPPQDYQLPTTRSTCYITGWGKIRHPGSSHPILQQAKMPPVPNVICHEKLKESPGSSSLTITENMLCAGKEGTNISGCHGDSGGPYVCKDGSGRWFLQGSVSWGSPRCSAADRYTVFARLAKFRKWIDHHVNKIEV